MRDEMSEEGDLDMPETPNPKKSSFADNFVKILNNERDHEGLKATIGRQADRIAELGEALRATRRELGEFYGCHPDPESIQDQIWPIQAKIYTALGDSPIATPSKGALDD